MIESEEEREREREGIKALQSEASFEEERMR